MGDKSRAAKQNVGKLKKKMLTTLKKVGKKSKHSAKIAKEYKDFIGAESRWDKAGDKAEAFEKALKINYANIVKAHAAAKKAVAKTDYDTARKLIDGTKKDIAYLKSHIKHAAKYRKVEDDALVLLRKYDDDWSSDGHISSFPGLDDTDISGGLVD